MSADRESVLLALRTELDEIAQLSAELMERVARATELSNELGREEGVRLPLLEELGLPPLTGSSPYGPALTLPNFEGEDFNPYGEGSRSGVREVDDPTVPPPTEMHVKSNGNPGASVLEAALRYQGKLYGWGGTGPERFDCSGLAQRAYREGAGVQIPRTTYEQVKAGTVVPEREEVRPGDLVFSNFENDDLSRPRHVSIAADATLDKVVEAGDPVGAYPWGTWRGMYVVRRYVG